MSNHLTEALSYYNELTLKKLKEIAAANNIKGRSSMNKAELVNVLAPLLAASLDEMATMAPEPAVPAEPEMPQNTGQEVVITTEIRNLYRWIRRQTTDLNREFVAVAAEQLGILIEGTSIADLAKSVAAYLDIKRMFGIWYARRNSALAHLLRHHSLEDEVFLTEDANEEKLLSASAEYNNINIEVLLNVDGVDFENEQAAFYRNVIWVKAQSADRVKDVMGVQPMQDGFKALKQLKYLKQLVAPNYMGARVIEFDPNRVRIMPKNLEALFDGVIYIRQSMVESWLHKDYQLDGQWTMCLSIFRIFFNQGEGKGGMIPCPDHWFPSRVDIIMSEMKSEIKVNLPDNRAVVCFNSKWTTTKEAKTDFQTLINNFLMTSPRLEAAFGKTLNSLKKRFILLKEDGVANLMSKGETMGLDAKEYRDSIVDTLAALEEEGLDPKGFARLWTKAASRCTDGTVDPDRVRLAGGCFNDQQQWVSYALRTYIQVHPGMVFRWIGDLEGEPLRETEDPSLSWLMSDMSMSDGVLYTDEASAIAVSELHGHNRAFITRNPNTMTGGREAQVSSLENTPQCTYWIKPSERNWKQFFADQDGADLDDAFVIWLGDWADIAIEHHKVFKSRMIEFEDGSMSFLEPEKLKAIQKAITDPVKPWNWNPETDEPIVEGNIARIQGGVAVLSTPLPDCPYEAANKMARVQNTFSGMIGYAANWQMAMAMAIQGLIKMDAVKDKNGNNTLNILAQATVSCMLSDIIDCQNQGAKPRQALATMSFFAATSRYMNYQIEQATFLPNGRKNWSARELTIPRLGVQRMIGKLKKDLTPKQKWKNGERVTTEVFGQIVPVFNEHGRWIANAPKWPAYALFQEYIDWVIGEIRNDINQGLEAGTMTALGQAAENLMTNDEWLQQQFPMQTPNEVREHAKTLYAATQAYSRQREELSQSFATAKKAGANIGVDTLAYHIGKLNDEWLQNSWPEDKDDQMLMVMMVMIAKWRKLSPATDYKIRLQKNNLSLTMPGVYDEAIWLQDLVHNMEVIKTGPWRATIEAIKMLMPYTENVRLNIQVEMLMRKGLKSADYLPLALLNNQEMQSKIKTTILEQHQVFNQAMVVTGKDHSWEIVPASSRRVDTVNHRWKARKKTDYQARERIMEMLEGRKILDIKFVKKLDAEQTNLIIVLER